MDFSGIELPSNRKFGSFFTVIFMACSLYSYYTGSSFWYYFFGLFGIIFLVTTLFMADLLLPLNKLWLRLGIVLGIIVSPIVTGAIYFLIFTPVAIFLRLTGRDELSLRVKNKKSLWINRRTESRSESFKQQF